MVVCKYFQQGHCRFGQSCRNEHVYASKYSYRAPQAHSTVGHHENFNSNPSGHSFANSNASSLFRSAVQNTSAFQNQAGSSGFGPSPATRGSVFDRLGPQQNQAKSIFAQANQNSFGPVQQNIFHTQNPVNAKSLFAQTNQNVFGQSQTNFSQAQSPANVFATANQNLPNDPFRQQSSPVTNSRNVFQISNQPLSNPFGVKVEQSINIDDNVYSEMDELSKSDIEAFESAEFKLGFIPEIPPPRTLCF